jgi:CopG family transcriptional regulator/antitoxin EndoAI
VYIAKANSLTQANRMNRRINVILPESTVAVLAKVAPRGGRSRLIDRAIKQYVAAHGRQHLRAQLKREALANADRDLAMAAEWFPLEEEAWRKATRQNPGKGK